MNRVYNFSAGPSMLPLPVLERAASELICYGDSGMSVMEMSHRSPDYEEIIKTAEADLREIMSIPDNYKFLFRVSSPTRLPRRLQSCATSSSSPPSRIRTKPISRA